MGESERRIDAEKAPEVEVNGLPNYCTHGKLGACVDCFLIAVRAPRVAEFHRLLAMGKE